MEIPITRTQDPAEVVRHLIDAHNRGDAGALREILSPKLVWRTVGVGAPMGRDDYVAGFETGRAAFSDLVAEIEDLVTEGEKVAMRLRVRGRHTGELQGIAPTGRSIDFVSAWFYRVVERTIVEAWNLDEDFVRHLR